MKAQKSSEIRIYLRQRADGEQMGKEESRRLLKKTLALYCVERGGPVLQELEIREGDHGKPRLEKKEGDRWIPCNDLFFSISHTKNWWICAISRRPLGVDIEEAERRVNPQIAGRVFSKWELEWLAAGTVGAASDGKRPDEDSEAFRELQRRFLEIWVRKEAYLKYLGVGLSRGTRWFSTAGPAGTSALLETIGTGEAKACCSSLVFHSLSEERGVPIPLIGALCTEEPPEKAELRFVAEN